MKQLLVRTVAIAACTCSVLDGAAQAQMVLDNFDGPITERELAGFKGYIKAHGWPSHSWGNADTDYNAVSVGDPARQVEAMALVYEATGDREILDRLIEFIDAFVWMRNDLPGGSQRVMWTGKVEKAWVPNGPARPPAGYIGGENGHTIAHILDAAILILRRPSLWNTTVPDGNPRGFGATYLERAKYYIARTDEANDEYSYKQFVTSANLIRNPPGWPAGFHTMEAINIQMMLVLGYLKDALAHELLGDDPARVARYHAVVKTAVRECLDGMKKNAYTVNGVTVYKWGYYPWSTRLNEGIAHGTNDMLGLHAAWQRGIYGVTDAEVRPFADTFLHVISLGNDQFALRVDGSGGPGGNLNGPWLVVADWNRAVLPVMARAHIARGAIARYPNVTGRLLAMKQRFSMGDRDGALIDGGAADGGSGGMGPPGAEEPSPPSPAPPPPPPGPRVGPGCGCLLAARGGDAAPLALMASVLLLPRRLRLWARRGSRGGAPGRRRP